ncbi:Protein kinase superfamily protein with octicosapeptide/Phox/Bem1p domain [Abeliophyllum distichum]|uniref:Protein kinase superfamily protein with octicosapeptide/Phox/Bem1p domain n=1 Tax=Abeliophyllum distichum TaxID=126358 RepID=A0ABD1NUF1_9LAMI
MAFDQNSLPKDLRPLNIARSVPEDPRIAPVTSSVRPIEGFYGNPPRDAGGPAASDPMPPVYYSATISDAGFMPLGYNNAVPGAAGWVVRGVQPQCQPGVMGASVLHSAIGSSNSPKFGDQVRGSASDQAIDEGGNGSVSGRKVKFLCSFGGKILPRPSDGALRYVGGQTRIISVRRDVSFGELVQKMADTYGQNVVIKYQLPEEDLDALVTVSCPDDLENMLDEFEKLERSSDGSAKLRVFLFSPSELEFASLLHIGDIQDGGQRYVEAVNGILDGFGSGGGPGGGRIARKESFESAASAHNSDLSGTEGADNFGHGHGEVTGPTSTGGLSPRGNPIVSLETASRTMCTDPSAAAYADPSATRLGIPVAKSGPATTMAGFSEQESERYVPLNVTQPQMGFDFQQPGVTFPASSSHVQAYVDPHQETLNRADYVQLPSQMRFPAPIYGAVGPVFTQQHLPAGASPQQFIPAVNMTMNPSFISMRPNAVPAIVQPQQVRFEHYPAESTLPQRVVQVPADQGYSVQHAQVPTTVPGGVYGWHQVPHVEQVAFSDGGLPSQSVMVSEKIPRLDDCYMCQKALPHAHSDSIAQDQKGSPASTLSDSRSIYHSLQLEDNGQPMISPVLCGTQTEGTAEQLAAGARPRIMGYVDHEAGKVQADRIGVSQNPEGPYANDKTILQKAQNPEYFKVSTPQSLMLTSSAQSSHSVFVANIPQTYQDSVQQLVVPPQYQVIEGFAMNRPVNNDLGPVGGMPLQSSDYITRESPKDYPGKVASSIPKEDSTSLAFDQLRQIDKRLENLQMCPSEVLANNEPGKPVADPRKEDMLETRLPQVAGREAPKMHNFPPAESYELTEPPLLAHPNSYLHSKLGVNNLPSDEIFSGNPGVESAHSAERIPPTSKWKDGTPWSQPRIPADLESVTPEGNRQSSVDPSYGVADMPDNSNSLFSNQDPWSLRHDAHFPPRPSKIQIRKEAVGNRDPPDDSHPMNSGELQTGHCKELQIEVPLDDGAYLSSGNLKGGLRSGHVLSDKGSTEDLIKQELQAVAEGVAASVLHSSVPSNPDLSDARSEFLSTTLHNGEVQNTNTEMEHREKYEDTKTKLPEKINFGFPVSDSIGRLQIIKNSDLEELQELGSGTFGTVYHGKWRGTDVAIKRINDRCFAGKPSEQDRMREDFWNEAIKLADLHHPNVVAFYGVVLDGPSGSIATVTEYMVNGSLRNALQKSERNLDKRKRLLIAMDVAFGMEYLHGKNIVHFDLKSDNLLVNLRDPHRPICKVGDLGLSKVKCQTLISGGVRGTLPWMAPELLNGSSSLVSEKVDVFSYGIVMWELLTGEEPYTDLHYGAIIGGIVSNTLRPPVPESCDPDWRRLMERCWSAEPSERPSFIEIANDLRAMAAKLPPKGQVQQPQVKS